MRHSKLLTVGAAILLTCLILDIQTVSGQRSQWESFLPVFREFRQYSTGLLTRTEHSRLNTDLLHKLKKIQKQLPNDVKFPCNTTNMRSKERPTSVHRLRPGDIDVMAAMGDSLTAGFGLRATTPLQVFVENRGLSGFAGGEGNWKTFTTVPNILKEFNPKLIGYSTGDSLSTQKPAQLNVAEGGAMSRDMPWMAKVLIMRFKVHPQVNIMNDWKLINLMIGPNDFCVEMCYLKDPQSIVENHRKEIIQTLRLLRDNLPRTFVNLVLTPDLMKLTNFTLANRPPICYFTYNLLCPCLFGLQFEHQKSYLSETMKKWQKVDEEVANMDEFDTDTFTVVLQPFTKHFTIPKHKNGLTDYSYLSADCFHLSQKGNARAGNSAWNNLVEPVSQKSTDGVKRLFDIKCPTQQYPFLYTRRNS